jgi:hypothetical protein
MKPWLPQGLAINVRPGPLSILNFPNFSIPQFLLWLV